MDNKNIKCLLGSKMLRLANSRDEDWATFVNESAKVAREKGYKSIPFCRAIHDGFIRGKYIDADPYYALFIYQMSIGFHNEEDYPFEDFNIIKHKEVWIKWLKAYINDKKTEEQALKGDILPKQFYHILYQYNMIVENAHFISDEAKINVQKIHDLEMSKEYFYELREKINSL